MNLSAKGPQRVITALNRGQDLHLHGPPAERPRLGFSAAVIVALGLAGTSAPAEGFRNPPAGAFNLGRAGGRIAHIDDSSAIAQNPANLVDLTAPEVAVAPSLVYIRADYESANGETARTRDPWKVLPNFFAALPLEEGKFAAGIGVTTPYGISNEWAPEGSFANPSGLRYNTPFFAELKTINANPTFSAKIGEHFQAGIGLDVFWSELTLKQFFPWSLAIPGAPDGIVKGKGDGFGYGGNGGVTWKIDERNRLTATCRSPVTVCYAGDSSVSKNPLLGGGTSESTFATQVTFPTTVALGYGLQLTDAIRLEVDAEWIQFSKFDTLNLDLGANSALFPPGALNIRQDWKDTFTAGIGGDWRFAPGWVLRAGYQFYESPVPDHTFSPTIPDANQHVFTVGLGHHTERHALEIAYGADFYDRRHITGNQTPAFNGTYEITVHLFAFSYRYSFR